VQAHREVLLRFSKSLAGLGEQPVPVYAFLVGTRPAFRMTSRTDIPLFILKIVSDLR